MRPVLMRVVPNWLSDFFVELAGHWQISRAIDRAFAAGDREALAVFKTGTLAVVFTRRGLAARGDEFVEYARRVCEADGSCYRYHRTFADRGERD
ncbi:hypothetical protein G6045_19045 [Streptomyces sp. YC504]|uniref:Uncharacterized protein n=1 Tax=Streptomyces mesophilus TaxID=1775132 RepID=A0A6G4XM98_9ACTN|nr:hypothetical protein [Streptomyces mesophilus]NGO77741.1 hypothetical protein [Streptomyces mesophilus]